MAADDQSPADPMAEPALLKLAREKFGTLSRAEEELFRAAEEGRIASALANNPKEDEPADAANWNAERVVRAKCISWVCTDAQALTLITYRGLELQGMRIDGWLDLINAEIKFSIRAVKCVFSGDISLVDAQVRGFYLGGCLIKNLDAGRAIISGPILLRDGCKAEGEINLSGATIGGDLDCDGSKFFNAGGWALNAQRSRIAGIAFLRNFQAHGRVDLAAATIDSLQIRGVSEADQMILDLRLARVEAFWDDEESWPKAGNLFLDGFRCERLFEQAPFEAESRKKWLRLQPRDRFRPQPYEQLATVLRKMGHNGEARQVMIEKNRERAAFTHFPHQSWWWYNSFGRLIGYGYAPWRAFALSVAMILLGTFLFSFGATNGLISPKSENAYAKAPNGQAIVENGRKKILEEYPTFNAFFYSLESFTPLLKLDQSVNWAPNANHGTEIPIVVQMPATCFFHFWATRTGSLLRYYLYFHIASGWLLTSLWVGAITGLVKT